MLLTSKKVRPRSVDRESGSPSRRPSRRKPASTSTYMQDNFNSRYRSFSGPKKVISTRPGARSWIPAPGLSRPRGHHSCKAPRQSFPLCLVCDKDWSRRQDQPQVYGDGDEELARKFEANSALLKELDASARLSGEKQRLKLMKQLWEMDGGTTGQKLERWHDILKAETAMHGRKKESKRGGGERNRERSSRKKSSRRRSTTRDRQRESPDKRQQHREERSNGRAAEVAKRSEVDQKNLTESVSAKMVEKDGIEEKINREELLECLELIERSMASSVDGRGAAEAGRERGERRRGARIEQNDSTDISQSLQRDDHRIQQQHRSAQVDQQQQDRKTDSDFFIEVIIDELKRENRDMKFDLVARDKQLEKAADKVRELVEENSRLAKKLEKVESRAREQAETFASETARRDEGHSRAVTRLEERLAQLEAIAVGGADAEDVDRRRREGREEGVAVADDLRKKLEESLRKNENLEKYVEELKASYVAVFGEQGGAAAAATEN